MVSFGINLVHRVLNGHCEHAHRAMVSFDIHCNSNASSESLPLDTAFMLIITPVLFATVLRETNVKVLMVACMMEVLFIGIASSYLSRQDSLLHVLSLVLISLLIVYDTFQHNVNNFFLHEHVQEVSARNVELSRGEHKNEIRSMIGTVAHDLKTVSMAQMNVFCYML